MAQFHIASRKPYWRDYYSDEVRGAWRVHELCSGEGSSLLAVNQFDSPNPRDYDVVKEVAEVELYKAMQDERSGDFGRALSIRRDLIECGSLMRSQCTHLDGSLNGVSMVTLGMSNVGGKYINESVDSKFKRFTRLLTASHNGSLAAPVSAEYTADTYINSNLDSMQCVFFEDDLRDPLIHLWASDLYLVTVFIIFIGIGCVSRVASKFLNPANLRPLPSVIVHPFIVGTVVGATLFTSLFLEQDLAMMACTAVIIISALAYVLHEIFDSGNRSWKKSLLRVVVLAGSSTTIYILLIGLNRPVGEHLEPVPMMLAFGSNGHAGGFVEDAGAPILRPGLGLLDLELLCPLIFACLGLLVRCLVLKRPAALGIIIGLSRVSLPLAVATLMVLGIAELKTANAAQVVSSRADQLLLAEGKTYAEFSNRQWPGPTSWPTN